MKRFCAITLSVILFTVGLTSCFSNKGITNPTVSDTPSPTPANQQSTTINIGDYLQMGRYYDEAILWRCVDIDENGPLMLSDKILTIKPFDAKGMHKYMDGTAAADISDYRTSYGSNLWETSNIRSWLNSTATAGNVTWLDGCPPAKDKLKYNAYADEKGFLADGNFTLNEQNIIKSVTQKSLLNSVDVGKLSVGGTAIHKYDDSAITTVVQNFDISYYQNVVDKIFLLDVKQILRVHQNRAALGMDYYIGKLTQKSVDNSENKNGGLSANSYWHSLLRTPFTDSNDPIGIRGVHFNGTVISYSASNDYIGVRPAFYIDLSSLNFKAGNGTVGTPYVVD